MVLNRYNFIFLFSFTCFINSTLNEDDLNNIDKAAIIEAYLKMKNDLEKEKFYLRESLVECEDRNFKLKLKKEELDTNLSALQETYNEFTLNTSRSLAAAAGGGRNPTNDWLTRFVLIGSLVLIVAAIYEFVIKNMFPDKEYQEMCEEIDRGYREADEWAKENQHLITGKSESKKDA